jgi:hypothetical protein
MKLKLKIKRVFSIIVALAVVAVLYPASAVFAVNEKAIINITSPPAQLVAGQEFIATASIADNPGFKGFTFAVVYDAGALTLKSISPVSGGLLSSVIISGDGSKVSYFKWGITQVVEGDGDLFAMTFAVNDDAAIGDYPVALRLPASGNYPDGNPTNFHNASAPLAVGFNSATVSVVSKDNTDTTPGADTSTDSGTSPNTDPATGGTGTGTGKNTVTGSTTDSDTGTVTKSGTDKIADSKKTSGTGTALTQGKKTATTKPPVTSVKSIKRAGSNKLTVTWKKLNKAQKVAKYQIKYRVKTNTKSKWKIKTVSAGKSKIVLQKLKSGKKYQISVRSYKTAGKVNYYSAWSKVKLSRKVR